MASAQDARVSCASANGGYGIVRLVNYQGEGGDANIREPASCDPPPSNQGLEPFILGTGVSLGYCECFRFFM